MDSVSLQLLNCLSAYAADHSEAKLVCDCLDWTALYRSAQAHKLASVVYETLKGDPGFCAEHAALRAAWKMETISQAAAQARRSVVIVNLSNTLDHRRIPHAVVKGIVCRELYQHPDLRPSGDEDLLIAPSSYEACKCVLAELGFLLSSPEHSDVTHWLEPVSGLHLELHTALLSQQHAEGAALNRMFVESIGRSILTPASEGQVRTLPQTEHFIFLVCHAVKHFIAGGVGIRTLCDIVRFANVWEQQIDWDFVAAQLDKVRARTFLDQIFALGDLYWSNRCRSWIPTSKPDPRALLLDSMEAGIYGKTTETRQHSAALLSQAASHEGRGIHLIRVLFPPAKSLAGSYPILGQYPLLVPFCWVHRLGRYGLQVLSRHSSENSPFGSLALGKKRMEMMVAYDIFPKASKKIAGRSADRTEK